MWGGVARCPVAWLAVAVLRSVTLSRAVEAAWVDLQRRRGCLLPANGGLRSGCFLPREMDLS